MEWTSLEPDITHDPYPVYARLREGAPVHHVTFRDGLDGWLVTRYDDVRRALTDPHLSKDPRNASAAWQASGRGRPMEDRGVIGPHLLLTDPPDHTRLRRLAAQAFTPRRVAGLRPRIQQLADDLADRLARSAADRQVDVVGEFAFPLAAGMICELLGIPAGDCDRFRTWTAHIVSSRPGEADRRPEALRRLGRYLAELVERRRVDPAHDLTSALIAARDHDRRLDEGELHAMLFLLLIAGHETTVNLISNSLIALLRRPGQLGLLRERPALLPGAVEELLRFDGPVELAMWRFTTRPLAFGDVVVPAGQPVLPALASAHRDPAAFAHPDSLDLIRQPNPHLAFGHGVHFCLGAALARLEGEVALGTLLGRFPDLRLAVPDRPPPWRRSLMMRGLEELPVHLW
jgi:cytochrome P450